MMNNREELEKLHRQLEQNQKIMATDPVMAVTGLTGMTAGILMKQAEPYNIKTDPFTMKGMLDGLYRQDALSSQLHKELDLMRRCRNEAVMNNHIPTTEETWQCLKAVTDLLAYYKEQKGGE